MSGAGAPTLTVDGTGLKVVVVAASWHTVVMDGLLAGARRALEAAHVTDVTVIRVPGTFELPVAARAAAAGGRGRGRRARRRHPRRHAALRVRLPGGHARPDRRRRPTGVPVGFGVLTCDDEAQALDRAGLPGSHEDKGAEAAEAAVATVVALRGL